MNVTRTKVLWQHNYIVLVLHRPEVILQIANQPVCRRGYDRCFCEYCTNIVFITLNTRQWFSATWSVFYTHVSFYEHDRSTLSGELFWWKLRLPVRSVGRSDQIQKPCTGGQIAVHPLTFSPWYQFSVFNLWSTACSNLSKVCLMVHRRRSSKYVLRSCVSRCGRGSFFVFLAVRFLCKTYFVFSVRSWRSRAKKRIRADLDWSKK